MRKALMIFGAALAALALGSCERDAPAVLRVPWVADGDGYVQFRTNDTNDYNDHFTSFPNTAGNSLPGGADWTVEADVIQYAGTVAGGFGLLCGYTSSQHDWCGLILTCEGSYKLVYQEDGFLKEKTAWVNFGPIKPYEQVNTITAHFNNETMKITFSINGQAVGQYFDYDNGEASRAGFFNGILGEEYEGFPWHYSDRRFKLRITSPTSYTYPE
jgi:hypothetical protein